MRFFIGCLCLLAAACARPPDAEAIRTAIHAIGAAAEKRDVGGVLDRVAADFVGNEGELDHEGLVRLLRLRLLAGGTIGVSIGTIDVDSAGDRATAKFDVTLTDGSGRWIAEHRATLSMVTGWRREGREWRVYNARWTGGDG